MWYRIGAAWAAECLEVHELAGLWLRELRERLNGCRRSLGEERKPQKAAVPAPARVSSHFESSCGENCYCAQAAEELHGREKRRTVHRRSGGGSERGT